MREQNFNKIKKAAFILLAVFFVVVVTAAASSACTSKVSDKKCKTFKEKPIKETVKPVKEAPKVVEKKAAQELLGNKLLDIGENNWFGNGCGINLDDCLFGDD
jgi:hypothetical protein